MLSEQELIKRCIAGDKKAQEQLYQRYSPKLWGVCLRFAKSQMAAEDIMQEGFIRIFGKLKQYTGEGSFEGWSRKILINTAINYYKKNINHNRELDIDEVITHNLVEPRVIDKLSVKELMSVVQGLPDGYRMVFNLFVVEGYSHKEIGEQLGITENTSKSQLSRARQLLQEQIKKKLNINWNE